MTPRWMLSASLLLAAAQANSLYPASTFPLRELNRSPRFGFGNERTLYTGFQPPQQVRYEDYDDVASTRKIGCGEGWKAKGEFCYRHYPATQGGWTWDQARRECKTKAYSEGHTGADLAFPESDDDNNFIKGLLQNEDVWLGAKFPIDKLQKKNSTGNPETWGDYSGYTNWRDGDTPDRGISSERRLLMKGQSGSGVQTLGKWVVWNGNERKGFVCQFKIKGCKNGWKEDTIHKKCLKVFKEDAKKMTWKNALRKCEEQGLKGTLASLLVDIKVEDLDVASDNSSSISDLASARAQSTYNAYWLGGSVQYLNNGSLSYTWTDGTTGINLGKDAWANGYNKPTPWIGIVNTFINNKGKIGLNFGNDKANFICQYDVPTSVYDNLIHTGIYGAERRRSLF